MEPLSSTEVTDEQLTGVGLQDIPKARRILTGLAGQGVTDDLIAELLPSLLEALRDSPDPDRALNNFARWTEAVTSRYTHVQYLLRHPVALSIFFNVAGVSQLFSDILVRNPEYFEILANPGMRGGAKSSGATYREISGFVDGIKRIELKLEALRRFKQREFLRIGTRDILGLADMPTTAREFSNLADACVQKCLELAVAQMAEKYPEEHAGSAGARVPFSVIAMGKHGGRELNYSSDIDLMFVCADDAVGFTGSARLTPLQYAHKLAESLIRFLTDQLQNGHLFRVDMRLRPEGRFGALVRTLSSYQAYYESWAEPWERQSLLKARPVAGDARLGEAYMAMITPFVFRRGVTSDFVEAIRHNKERIEQKALQERQTHTNVKVGYGGIRDIEFTAQLLQLEMGGHDPVLRTPNTLEALARLRQAGALHEQEASELADDYQFLRTVEHRLQILYDKQTQSLPGPGRERELLARRLGFADAAAFDEEFARRTERVRAHYERLFMGRRRRGSDEFGGGAGPWRRLIEAEAAQEKPSALLLQALEAEGFAETERAAQTLLAEVRATRYGEVVPEARELFLSAVDEVIAACTRTGDPDAGLKGLISLAEAMPNPAPYYRTLLEGEEVLFRLSRLAAGSPPLMQALARHPEWLDLLVSEEVIDPVLKTVERAVEELDERLPARGDDGKFFDALALYVQRERLRIGAREIWGEIGPLAAARELSALADAVLIHLYERPGSAALAGRPHPSPRPPELGDSGGRAGSDAVSGTPAHPPLVLVGLGKLGGQELSYGSDWDFQATYGKRDGEDFSRVSRSVEFILSAGKELQARGAPVEIDARLRPEGRVGALAYAPEELREYYSRSALTWERQVLTKARVILGDAGTADAYQAMVEEVLYAAPLSDEAAEEIRSMKRRIETERLKPAEKESDVKLGHGGMSDIEFLTQLLQLRAGAAHPAVRTPNTVDALHALGAAGALPAPDAARLAESYAFYTAMRSRMTLRAGLPMDTLPGDARALRALAIGLGFADMPGARAEEQFRRQFEERMRDTRRLFERLF